MTTGEKIKMLRKRHNIKQIELAEKIGETKQTVYKYENDIVNDIPYVKLEMIASVFNVSPAYLLGWDHIKDECEEMILLRGYRAASEERKSDMLDLARKALKKQALEGR